MAMETRPPIETLIEIQVAGVDAISQITAGFDEDTWGRPSPCEGWTALDLAGHVLTVANNWHILLDDSEARAPEARFGLSEMGQHFQRLLAELPDEPGPARIAKFQARIGEYFDRVRDLDPELPLVSALTEVAETQPTIGTFVWLGGVEWHVHAWDFAQVAGQSYSTAHGATIHAGTRAVRPFSPPEGDPWESVLGNYRSTDG